MPTGSSPKREREYKKLVKEFHEQHRYPGHEEEVAARIVNKQRKEHGDTKSDQQKGVESTTGKNLTTPNDQKPSQQK